MTQRLMDTNRLVGKTLRAQWLGQQLRRLRLDCGMTLHDVAQHLDRDRSALSRYESGEWPIRKADVASMIDLYGIHKAAERAALLSLAEEVWRTDHWDENYGDIVDSSLIDLPWLESRAAEIKIYDVTLLHGLIQTREYAETLIRGLGAPGTPEATIKRYVDFRMERQEILTKKGAPWVRIIVEESALRRPVGGAAIMRAQLARLRQAVRTQKVEVRVLSAQVGVHAGLIGPFSIYHMPAHLPAVAYIENLGGRLYLEMPKAQRFIDTYARLQEAALDPRESAELIAAVAEEIT